MHLIFSVKIVQLAEVAESALNLNNVISWKQQLDLETPILNAYGLLYAPNACLDPYVVHHLNRPRLSLSDLVAQSAE